MSGDSFVKVFLLKSTEGIAQYRVDRGHGASEDYMILGKALSVLKLYLTLHFD